MLGQTISHYRVLRKLGGGGMGVVFEAEDTKLGRHVALKFLPEELSRDPEALERFRREARAASSLNHPNICTIYEIDDEHGQPFIAMELLEGKTLKDAIGSKPMDTETLFELGIQIASALEAAHGQGIVHRDVKPGNIFVTTLGQAKVLDFGLAKREFGRAAAADLAGPTMTTEEHLTSPGTTMGTVAFMSPEQVEGKELDARTDLFSFGAVLYEMATARQAFSGNTSGVIFNSILEKTPAPPSRLNAELPQRLDEIVAKALEKDRDVRYQHAADIRADLKRLRRDTTSGTAAVQTTHGQEPHVTRWRKRTLLFAPAVAIVVAGLYFAIRFFTTAREAPISSIAVLPFSGGEQDTVSQDLEDGITEGIIDELSQTPNLKVMSGSSVFRYKSKTTDVQKLGKELNVDAVVAGRIVRREGNVTIDAELVKVNDNSQIWGQRYSEKMGEVGALEQELVSSISRQLRQKLGRETTAKESAHYTENAEAYNLYLRGRHEVDRVTDAAFLRAVQYFQQAIDKDPNFAPAYAGLASAYSLLGLEADLPASEAFGKAGAAAKRALQLDDSSAEAHSAAGFVHLVNGEFSAAEPEFRRAIELNPNIASVRNEYSMFLRCMGRFAEAEEEGQRALDLDPGSQGYRFSFALVFYSQHQYDRTIAELKKMFEIDPNSPQAHLGLSWTYDREEMYDQAMEELEKYYSLTGLPDVAEAEKRAQAQSGRKGFLLKDITIAGNPANRATYFPIFVAIDYVELGDKDKAFAWLERAYDEHIGLMFLKVDPAFDSLRSDPRFEALLRKTGFPQ